MNQPNAKFPFWRVIIINFIWWVAVVLCIRWIIHYCDMYHGPVIDGAVIAMIGTMIVSAALVTTNIILVAVTKTYVDQTTRMTEETAKMAQETKAMVKYHELRWRIDLQPLFVPITYESNDVNTLVFRFRNFGNLALFIQCGIRGELCNEYKYVESGGFIEIRPTDMDELINGAVVTDINNPDDSIMTWVTIDYQDKLTNKYRQNFNFYFRKDKWDFDFNESSLPKEKA